ncbi:ABC transporter substrate-binding protein [Candidatus Pelagibacter sp.]|nr:ABC transporter substrate-binding protein [Candidatus Pelagibacter sp.]
MVIKKIYIFSLSIFFLISAVNNSYTMEPEKFVQQTVNYASEALNKNFTKEEKIKRLKNIAKNSVDIRGIGYYSLGAHRKSLSDSKKKEYLEIFEKYFLKTFASRLAEYTDPKIRVDYQKKLNDKYTMVYSVLIATEKRPEIKINWRIITRMPNEPLIIDVVIEGVSLAKVQKEEFNSIIQSNNGNIEALFQNLEEFVIR